MPNLASLALDIGAAQKGTGSTSVADILTFAESRWGLGMELYPVQRIILKLHYGMPLDDNPYGLDLSKPVPRSHPQYDEITLKNRRPRQALSLANTFPHVMSQDDWGGLYENVVMVSDWKRRKWKFMSEVEYLNYLFEKGQCSVRTAPGTELRVMILSVGRRSGKTQLASIIGAYETYKLISKGDPQEYYGLPAGEPIQLISVATDKEQAGILYSKVAGYYKDCAFFAPYTANNTMSYARFQTPKDIERYGRYVDDEKANATIRVTFRPCRAKGLRGAGNIVIILDEMAHFTDAGQSSATEVWNAVKPSMSAFSPAAGGPVEGRMIGISSPLGRQGEFYKQFQLAMSGAPNMIAIQAPTWEVNPFVDGDELEQAYRADPVVFFTEYGGHFTDRTRGWIEDEDDLLACVDTELRPKLRGRSRQPHYIGLDFALAGDGSAIAIGHLGDDGTIELDVVEQIRAGEGEYAHLERLEFDDVADWVTGFSKRFMFAEGIFDQWAGIVFEQALHNRGLKMLQSEHFTKQLSSQMFRNFKDFMWDKRLRLYDWPKPSKTGDPEAAEHCPYIEELLELQAEYQTKYLVTVEAPNIKGKHDDMSDALVRMVWCASQHIIKPKHIAGRNNNLPPGMLPQRALTAKQARKARIRAMQGGGSSPDRQPSRSNRGSIRGR